MFCCGVVIINSADSHVCLLFMIEPAFVVGASTFVFIMIMHLSNLGVFFKYVLSFLLNLFRQLYLIIKANYHT